MVPDPGSDPISPRKRLIDARREDEVFKKDKGYRKFAANIKETLNSFDAKLQDWADYISFLNRLLKAIHAHPSNVSILPSKSVISQRLAQCMVPTLPNGVHQKAIEVYSAIFNLIGKDDLARDLSLYFPGLSSTLSFASLSVRPLFLSILENFILPLDPKALRPATKAVVLSLLPGLEEETGEDFDRTIQLVDKFRTAIQGASTEGQGDEFFWQCFFLASLTSSSRSQGSLAYLVRRLPKMIAPASRRASTHGEAGQAISLTKLPGAIEAVISPEPGLLVRSLAAGLEHDQILIQRGFLDILTSHVPLDSPVLQERVKQEDLDLLILAATGIVLRRDTSLNRRLWNWLLGPEPANQEDSESEPSSPTSANSEGTITPRGNYKSVRTHYFLKFGLSSLVRGLRRTIDMDNENSLDQARPLRICQSLMDRWEIGGLVVPEIFIPAINSVRRYKAISPSKERFREVLRSASVFFDGIESALIWGKIVELIISSLGPGSRSYKDRHDFLDLVKFIVGHFNLREEEMLVVHIPTAVLATSSLILSRIEADKESKQAKDVEWNSLVKTAFEAIQMLTEYLPDSEHTKKRRRNGRALESATPAKLKALSIVKSIHAYYGQSQASSEAIAAPFTPTQIEGLILRICSNIIDLLIASRSFDDEFTPVCSLFVKSLNRARMIDFSAVSNLYPPILALLIDQPTKSVPVSHKTMCITASVAISMYTNELVIEEQYSELLEHFVNYLWLHLSPTFPKYHVETVRVLWQLQASLSPLDRQIEALLSALVAKDLEHEAMSGQLADPGQKLSILWTHTIQQHSLTSDFRNLTVPSSTKQQTSTIIISPSDKYEIMLTRPMLLLLGALEDESSALFIFVRGWIQTLPTVDRLLWLVLSGALSTDIFQHSSLANLIKEGAPASYIVQQADDLATCQFYVHTLYNVLRWSYGFSSALVAPNIVITSPDDSESNQGKTTESFQNVVTNVAMQTLGVRVSENTPTTTGELYKIQKDALSIVQMILSDDHADQVAALELEYPLMDFLLASLDSKTPFLQLSVLDCLLSALKLRLQIFENAEVEAVKETAQTHRRNTSKDTIHSSKPSVSTERSDMSKRPGNFPPPPQLQKCLQEAFDSKGIRPVLDNWVNFLAQVLPLYSDAIFQVLIPFVECFCRQISSTFDDLKNMFSSSVAQVTSTPESALISLMNGLEQILAQAHDQLLLAEARDSSLKSPEQAQGLFGSMVSGVFASETSHVRSATANDRLTVILSFQDTVRICFQIWSWGSSSFVSVQDQASLASFTYTSLRMRNRARRMLEHLFNAEPLECLEVVVGLWQKTRSPDRSGSTSIFDLLHVLDGSMPKHTIPAIFNSIYSRANPNALDPIRQSTLTSELADVDVAVFLVEYAKTLEDDAMDEIWLDCMTFIKDVLQNPFPHRQTLPSLLEFTAVLGVKVDNTNFGDKRKMRRELGDIFMRLLTATFTSKPVGFATEDYSESVETANYLNATSHHKSATSRPEDIVSLLALIVPTLPTVLSDSDRISNAVLAISTNVILPTLKSKRFPKMCGVGFLELLLQLSRLSGTQKVWKKDVNEVFNDPRFFAVPVATLKQYWLPLLRQWTIGDRERMPEFLNRLSAPTTAGIMFGVGASSARIEADRKTQLNLKRIALLLISSPDDTFTTNIATLQNRITDLLTATSASSPSSATRAELYLLIRALVIKTNQSHLAPLWPSVSCELQDALSAVLPGSENKNYTPTAMLQACKLLDILLALAPDEFQLHEWLFVTDTIDAVYRPLDYKPIALVDEISNQLGAKTTPTVGPRAESPTQLSSTSLRRRPLLPVGTGQAMKESDIAPLVLRPFFSQLSIYAFESTYQTRLVDRDACIESVLFDLCDYGEGG
ncbi:MAG: hypothetical protein M1814_000867 [Vezdaea aestivalis]|nr:MAG: hypothetical protein M1814_000867 [Vezdaea aestivalis]